MIKKKIVKNLQILLPFCWRFFWLAHSHEDLALLLSSTSAAAVPLKTFEGNMNIKNIQVLLRMAIENAKQPGFVESDLHEWDEQNSVPTFPEDSTGATSYACKCQDAAPESACTSSSLSRGMDRVSPPLCRGYSPWPAGNWNAHYS